MSTNKNIDRICVVITICAVVLTCLFMNGKALGLQAIVDEDAESYEGTAYFTASDMNGAWDTEDAVSITLMGDDAEISGNGAYVYDGDLYITGAGKYVISGESTGSIIVDAYDSSKVYILLDSVDIDCADDAAFKVEQADKVFLTLAEGSSNHFVSGSDYSDEAKEDGVTGAIFSHDDLTINGTGSLEVTAGFMHGIVAKDDLVITGGTILVTAPTDAIRANDSLRIMDANITVDAGDDGIVINHEDGYFYMESGTVDVTSKDDGFHSAGDVTIAGGDITVAAGDDGIHSDKAFEISAGNITITECYEGIEAITIDIDGGDILIYPEDDGLNANGGSGDMFGMGGGPGGMGGMGGRGMHGMGVSGDSISGDAVSGMPYMPPGMSDNMFRGMSDNGIPQGNEASSDGVSSDKASSDAASADASEDEETYVHINGGTLTIINNTGQDADGIDSNGDLIISGGTIRISLINNGNNSALDYGSESGGVAEITGGTVVACGNYSMAEQFDSSSTQASILYTYSEGAEAGTVVSLEDVDGNVILSYEAPQSFSSVNISCPEMQVGETYLIAIGGNAEEITLDEMSASYGDAASGGFGGNMNFGGMRPRGDFSGDTVSGQGGFPGHGRWGGSVSSDGTVSGDDAFMMPPGMDVSGNDMQDGGFMGGPGGQDDKSQTADQEEAAEAAALAVSGTDIREFGSDTWISLIASIIAIATGICFAAYYRRRR